MAKIRVREVLRAIVNQKSPRRVFEEAALDVAKQQKRIAMEKMINNIREHKVTQEIEAGPESKNVSGTLPGLDGGNLFSFIGFEKGSQPVDDLISILEQRTRIVKKSKFFSLAGFTTRIVLPTEDEIRQATPLPWEKGLSWALGIERGISGFGAYIYWRRNSPFSRSGAGLQAKDQFGRPRNIRTGSFRRVNYLTDIFAQFVADASRVR